MIFVHGHVGNSHTQTEHLFQLKLQSCLDFVHLGTTFVSCAFGEIKKYLSRVTQQIILAVALSAISTMPWLVFALQMCWSVLYLIIELTGCRNRRREFPGLVQSWSEQTWDHLDHRLGRHEAVILFCYTSHIRTSSITQIPTELFHKLLILVELFQILDRHGIHA